MQNKQKRAGSRLLSFCSTHTWAAFFMVRSSPNLFGDIEARRAFAGLERVRLLGRVRSPAPSPVVPPFEPSYIPIEERLPGSPGGSAATGRSARTVFCAGLSNRGPGTYAGPNPGGRHFQIPRIRNLPGADPARELTGVIRYQIRSIRPAARWSGGTHLFWFFWRWVDPFCRDSPR
jgi:hypothetical protein